MSSALQGYKRVKVRGEFPLKIQTRGKVNYVRVPAELMEYFGLSAGDYLMVKFVEAMVKKE